MKYCVMIRVVMTYKQVYKYRSFWMGLAILWIIFYHAKFDFRFQIFTHAAGLGYLGSDIFLFASGLGCAFSYQKSKDPLAFLKKRFFRIFPTYLLFMLFWVPYRCFTAQMPLKSVIGNFLGVEYLSMSGYGFNWYYPCILIFYMLTPVLVGVINSKKNLPQFIPVILVLFLISVPFFRVYDFIIIASRLPIFAIGIYFALSFSPDEKVAKKTVILLVMLTLAGFVLLEFLMKNYDFSILWNYGLYWYPAVFITPGLCFLLSFVCKFIEMSESSVYAKLLRLFSGTGSLSFELYLVHIFFLEIYERVFDLKENLTLAAAVVFSFAGAYLLKITKNKLFLK